MMNKAVENLKAATSSALQNTEAALNSFGEQLKGFLAGNPKADQAAKALETYATQMREAMNVFTANLSGATALAQATELSEQQKRYNDVLATRLAEALDRIEALEKRLPPVDQK